jgi:hypothetical protein
VAAVAQLRVWLQQVERVGVVVPVVAPVDLVGTLTAMRMALAALGEVLGHQVVRALGLFLPGGVGGVFCPALVGLEVRSQFQSRLGQPGQILGAVGVPQVAAAQRQGGLRVSQKQALGVPGALQVP